MAQQDQIMRPIGRQQLAPINDGIGNRTYISNTALPSKYFPENAMIGEIAIAKTTNTKEQP